MDTDSANVSPPPAAAAGADDDDSGNKSDGKQAQIQILVKKKENVHVSNHPVLSHKISVLRSSSTSPASFRSVLREITFHLGYEATSNLRTKAIRLSVPIAGSSGSGNNAQRRKRRQANDQQDVAGHRIADRVALVPILRSGLGMVEPMLELLPDAGVHHIGMYRQRDLMPVQYYNRLPRKCESDVAFVLDPVVATANTVMSVCSQLKKWGVKKIHVLSVIASQDGLNKLLELHPDVTFTLGTVDKELNDNGDVLPGLGDAGDRLFGTPLIHSDCDDDNDDGGDENDNNDNGSEMSKEKNNDNGKDKDTDNDKGKEQEKQHQQFQHPSKKKRTMSDT